MARFGRSFLQAATQPAYMEGLFTAAQQIGAAPAEKRRLERLDELKKMGAVEQAQYMKSIARTPQEILQAQQLEKSAVQEGSLRSLQGLEVARQAAKTDKEKLTIERIMSRVAVQAGVDPTSIAGRTQAEQDATAQRELRQIQLTDKQRQQQEAAISQAYYAVPEKSRAAFEKNAEQSGFGTVIDELREDRERDKLFNLQLANAQTQAREDAAIKKAPLPRTTLEERINDSSIDPELKDQFLSELADIKEPDFEAGETWNPGERKLAEDAMRSLNASVRNEVGREVARKSAIRTDIRRLEQELTKGPSFREIQAQEAEAKRQLGATWYLPDPSEEEIQAKAYDLALLAKQDNIEELLTQRRFELGEQPVQEPEETETEEKETKQIGGYTVREVK